MGGIPKKLSEKRLEARRKAFDANNKKHAGLKRPGSRKK